MMRNGYLETINNLTETEAKKALVGIYQKLSNIGHKGYSSEKFIKDIEAIYERNYIERLFETTNYVKTPRRFYK